MKIETKKLPRGQVELTIELTVEEYQPFLQQAVSDVSQSVKIPGFRPGKANFAAVKQHVGENEIWQQALEPAVRKTFIKAIEQEKIMSIGSPEIDVVKLAAGNPVIYKAIVNIIPAVTLADYSKIKVDQKKVEIGPDKIDEALNNLQKMRAAEILVDREVKTGDKVEINFETFVDKVPVENGANEKFPLVIGEKTFIPGFEDQLIGLKKDQEKTFQLEFPKNYHQKNLAGKPAEFKIKMLAVYQRDLPELNDEFAKGLGEFKNLAELKDKIKENIATEENNKEKIRLEEEIIEKIIDQSSFEDIPDLLINSETEKMVDELAQNISNQGLKFEDYLNHLKKTRDELLLDFAPQATRRVKSALVIREISKKQKITVTDEEIENDIKKTIQMYGDQPEIKKQIDTPAYRDYLRNVITSRKTIDYLKDAMVTK